MGLAIDSVRLLALITCTSALLTVSTPAASQQNPGWQQPPAIMMPGLIAPAQATVNEDDPVVELPLRWPEAIRLAQQVGILDGNDEIMVEAGTLLPKVQIGQGSGARAVFCTRRGGLSVQLPRAALFPGGLLLGAYDSLVDGQTCLEDSDGDGRLDRVVLLGESGNLPRDAGSIEPVPFDVLRGEAIDLATDLLRISLRSVRARTVRIEVNFVQKGARQTFDVLSSGPYTTTRFVELGYGEGGNGSTQIFGVDLRVIEADRRAGTALIAWAPVTGPNEIIVVPSQVSISSR